MQSHDDRGVAGSGPDPTIGGRVAILESMQFNDETRNLLMADKPLVEIERASLASGSLVPFARYASFMMTRGIIGPSEALTVCPQCGIPHHVECWDENEGCTVWGCQAAPSAGVRMPSPGDSVRRTVITGNVLTVFNREYTAQQNRPSASQGCLKAVLAGSVGLAVMFILFGIMSGARSSAWALLMIVAVIVVLPAVFRRWRRRTRS